MSTTDPFEPEGQPAGQASAPHPEPTPPQEAARQLNDQLREDEMIRGDDDRGDGRQYRLLDPDPRG